MVIRGARRTERDCRAMSRQNSHIASAHAHPNEFITDLIREDVASGDVRNDIPPGELAAYCLHALAAASGLGSKAAAVAPSVAAEVGRGRAAALRRRLTSLYAG
jgi:hypothetical protein